MTIILGLTGQTGAGKSTASKFFAEQGALVLNADVIARETIESSLECLTDMVLEYSTEIITPEGKLDRKKLASLVFSDAQKLARLNAITYPHIVREITQKIENAKRMNVGLLVLDAPTLFESGLQKQCHKIVGVLADKTLRMSRIMERDSMTQQEAQQRINAQKPDEYYASRCDRILRNDTDKQLFRLDLMNLYSQIMALKNPRDPLPAPTVEETPPPVAAPAALDSSKLFAALTELGTGTDGEDVCPKEL